MSTKISWCDEVWNPVVGCPLPLCSVGCEHCWARRQHNIRHKAYLAGKKLPKMYAKPFEEIQFFPERLEQPLHWKKPRTIFVGSQTDLFHESFPFEWIDKIFGIMCGVGWHTYQILTKRPKVMLKYFTNRPSLYWSGILYGKEKITKQWPFNNVWLGVTAENQEQADKRIPILLQIPAAKRFVSIEPCLEEIDLKFHSGIAKNHEDLKGLLNWVIVGCESGPKRRPCKIEWVRSVVEQCKEAGLPVFVKQLEINGKVCHDIKQFPKDLKVQEWPK